MSKLAPLSRTKNTSSPSPCLHPDLDARDLAGPREAKGVGREARDRLAKKRRVGLDGRQAPDQPDDPPVALPGVEFVDDLPHEGLEVGRREVHLGRLIRESARTSSIMWPIWPAAVEILLR